VESWDELQYEPDSKKSQSGQFTCYKYKLEQKDLQDEVKRILKQINSVDDKNLDDDRLKQLLESCLNNAFESLKEQNQ